MIIERRLDMSFQTERPKSTAEMIAELKESKLERKSNRKALLENYNAKKLSDDRQSVLEATQAETEEKALTEEHIESIRDRRREERAVKEASLNRLTLLESAKKITMNKVLFEMVYDAYWLDDNVKRESIQETYNEYRNVLGLVENVCGGSKTKDGDKTEFIKNVESVVEEACKKAVDRIIKEQKESGEPTKEFEFTSEEESDLDKKLSELGRDEIVDLVKKKVLTVVQDERKSGKEKAEMLKELDNTENEEDSNDTGKTDSDGSDDDNTNNGEQSEEESALKENAGYDYDNDFDPVEESFAAGAVLLGLVITCVALEKNDQIKLKKAIKIYESNENPKVKISSLTASLFELDRVDRATDKKLTGIKKFFTKNSRRAKVWESSSGEYICSNIMYSNVTDVKNGIGVSSDGNVTPTINIETTTYRLYDINKKYKEDEAYLCAAMCLADGVGNENSWRFVEDIKKKYPDEFKNTKVKFFGKSLEGTEYEEEPVEEGAAYDSDFEPVEEGFFKNIKDNMQHNKAIRDVSKYLNLFGKDCGGVFQEAATLQRKGEYDNAIKKYNVYINIIKQKQKDADKYIKEKGYDSSISQAIRTGLSQEINLTKSYIAQCNEKKKKSVSENYQVALESMIAQKQRRSLRNSMGGTLFESFMIANSNSIRDEAIMEGVDIDTASAMNAALIETILQYTVLETLNTTKLYNFTSSDVMKIKAHNRSTLRD